MKKVACAILILAFALSCSSSKVCGGSGGKRVVNIQGKELIQNLNS